MGKDRNKELKVELSDYKQNSVIKISILEIVCGFGKSQGVKFVVHEVVQIKQLYYGGVGVG